MKAKAFALNDILPPITGNVFEGIKQVCQHMNRSDKPTSSLAILTLDPHRNSNCQRAQKTAAFRGQRLPGIFTNPFTLPPTTSPDGKVLYSANSRKPRIIAKRSGQSTPFSAVFLFFRNIPDYRDRGILFIGMPGVNPRKKCSK